MKRILTYLLLTAIVLFAGCSPKPKGNESLKDYQPPTVDEEAEIPVGDDDTPYKIEDGPRFDISQGETDNLVRFVSPFNTHPQEFKDAAELSDETLIFTAVTALDSEFVVDDLSESSTVSLDMLNLKIRELFGSNAALSAEYMQKDYSPYVIDKESGQIVRESYGTIGGFYLPYAVIGGEDEYTLYLIDLMDPLFFSDEENQRRLYEGEKIELDEIEEISSKLQYNIYTLRKDDNGKMFLAAFEYENFKNIDHLVY
ncbi:MAG: hypothetical protein GX928_04705 [Ruminococcaceae bacterium]|nr:hypothetical protein [Oscillospiraceae bacterium]